MAPRTVTDFDSLEHNFEYYVRDKQILDAYDEDHKYEGDLRAVAGRTLFYDFPRGPNRESDRNHILHSAPVEEVVSILTQAKNAYNDELKPSFRDSSGIERLVDSTPKEVKEHLKKGLLGVVPKEEKYAQDPEAVKAHMKYYNFVKSVSDLHSSDQSKAQNAFGKLANMVNELYDESLKNIPANERAGYEKMYKILKAWTLNSQAKLQENLKSIEAELKKQYETKVLSKFESYIKGNLGRKAIKKLYEQYFTRKLIEEQNVLAQVSQSVERNDKEFKDYDDDEFDILDEKVKYKDIRKKHQPELDEDNVVEVPVHNS
jgi:hypothetical protein